MTGQQPEPQTNYRCPSCGGGFRTWNRDLSYAVTGNQYCPFCGLQSGEYGTDEDTLGQHEQAIRGTVEWAKGLTKMLISLDESIDDRIESAIADHEREQHGESQDE